jgi:hypothetical protein
VAEKKMTNIRLDPALWARVKLAAGERGITLERWVTEALETYLGHQPSVATEARGGPSTGEGGEATARRGPADGTAEGKLRDLHWRVEALEAAVDYLAGVIGVGFPLGSMSGGAGHHPPGRPIGAAGVAERHSGGVTPPIDAALRAGEALSAGANQLHGPDQVRHPDQGAHAETPGESTEPAGGTVGALLRS